MRIYLTLLAAMLVPTLAGAEPLATFVTQKINVSDGDALALATVCTNTYAHAANEASVSPERADQALQTANGNAVAAGQALGAVETLDFHLIRLGQSPEARILVAVTRTVVAGAPRTATIDLASLDDAPAACDRLSRALLTGASIDEVRDRGNVTGAEANVTSHPQRLGAERMFWTKFSLGSPLESGYQPIGSARFGVNFEENRYLIELGGGFIMPSFSGSAQGYGGLAVELGASYFLNEGVNALFIGGGVEPRINFGGSVLELAPYAQVGGMLWRDSRVRLFTELRVAQNLLPVAAAGSVSSTVLPTELSLYAGIGF